MKDNQWIKDLRRKASEHEMPPPENLWADIERSLPPRRRTGLLRSPWLYAGMAASIAILLTISPSEPSKPTADLPQTGTVALARPSAVTERVQNDPLSPLAEPTIKTRESTRREYKDPGIGQHNPSRPTDPLPAEKHPVTVDKSTPRESTGTLPPSTATEQPRNRPTQVSLPEPSAPKRSLSLTLYAENMTGGKQIRTGGYSPVAGNLTYGEADNEPIGSNPAKDIFIMNQGREVNTHTRHHLPLRFGANLTLPLSGRLSIETGITYSLLSSTTESGSTANLYETRQRLHYLGVPLRVNYELLSLRRFSLYAGAGGMVEKCIYGKAKTNYIIGGKNVANRNERISENRLQYSIAASLGMEYGIGSTLTLFAEPGISYYPDNHSTVNNSYKEKPLNFDLKLGLRFTLDP